MRTLPCQRGDVLAAHGALARLRWRIAQGLGIRSGIHAAIDALRPAPRARLAPRLGRPSRFAVGDWVRVRERPAVEATLDAGRRLRGLVWVPSQWDACGRVYRVQKQVRRIVDDAGRMRAVSGTVLLEGCDCGGDAGDAGCGRHCPLMFRDEWLEPAEAPTDRPDPGPRRRVRVRAANDIRRTLDGDGCLDGVRFMPDMARFAGAELRVQRRLDRVYELDRWCPPHASLVLLEGAHCSGASLRAEGPCDRACVLVWHEAWLEPIAASGADAADQAAR